MDGEWRDSSFAEYAKFPLKNVYSLNENLLMNNMGYNIADMYVLPYCLVPFGALSEFNVKPGETVIVAPATGRYGGVAVAFALAMGAPVIAAGRNEKSLHQSATAHTTSKRLYRLSCLATRQQTLKLSSSQLETLLGQMLASTSLLLRPAAAC